MIGYVARDKNGKIYLHVEPPFYEDEMNQWLSSFEVIDITEKFPEFDSISYTDEPVKVEIKLEKV